MELWSVSSSIVDDEAVVPWIKEDLKGVQVLGSAPGGTQGESFWGVDGPERIWRASATGDDIAALEAIPRDLEGVEGGGMDADWFGDEG
jgi:hypothetical protein